MVNDLCFCIVDKKIPVFDLERSTLVDGERFILWYRPDN